MLKTQRQCRDEVQERAKESAKIAEALTLHLIKSSEASGQALPDWVTETPPGKPGGKLAAMASLLAGGETSSGFRELEKALRLERGAGTLGDDGAAPNSAKTTSSETTFETLASLGAGGRLGETAAAATEGGAKAAAAAGTSSGGGQQAHA